MKKYKVRWTETKDVYYSGTMEAESMKDAWDNLNSGDFDRDEVIDRVRSSSDVHGQSISDAEEEAKIGF